MNLGFVGSYLLSAKEELRRRRQAEREGGMNNQYADYGSMIPKGGGRPFNTDRYDDNQGYVAGGNYGNPVNQHPRGRRGIEGDLLRGLAKPAGGIWEAAIRGELDPKPSPTWSGTNEDVRRMNELNRRYGGYGIY